MERVAFGAMSTMYCFQCSREYIEEVTECLECGVELVEEKPTPAEEVGDQDEAQVAYELYEWSFEARRMLEGLLTGEGISHGWQGAVVIVREADEDRVDGLVEQAETADGPILDPDVDKIGYGMDDWTAEAQSALVDALGLAGIAHEFSAEGELIIAEENEEQADEIIEQVTERIAIDDELGEASQVIEGLALNDLLGDVRVLANKLVKNGGDAKSTLAMVKKADLLSDVRTPFGFDSRRWSNIRLRATQMIAILSDEHRGEDDVLEGATALSEELREVV
jgi:hypothetical protein